jgi:hypothetical protein
MDERGYLTGKKTRPVVVISVVVVAFQIIFCIEMHVNNFFFIFLKLFLTLVD